MRKKKLKHNKEKMRQNKNFFFYKNKKIIKMKSSKPLPL